MSLFHTHHWIEKERMQSRRFERGEIAGAEMSEHLAERILFGVTTIVLRCEGCGNVKTVEILGIGASS